MNIEIQTEIFRELLEKESLLKNNFKFQILRSETQDILVKIKELRDYGHYKSWGILNSWRIKKDDITTVDQVTVVINCIWKEVSDEYKIMRHKN